MIPPIMATAIGPKKSLRMSGTGYVRAVARAAGNLQAGRYLLPMDVSAYVEEAESSSVLK